jgi:hypothetical protein
MITNRDIDDILARQDHLCKHAPTCPRCYSHQIQIMDKAKPAKWRCRICWKRFTHEPPEASDELPSVPVVPRQ